MASVEDSSGPAAAERRIHRRTSGLSKILVGLFLAFGAATLFVVAGAIWGTTENSPYSPADLLLWLAMPLALITGLTGWMLRRQKRALSYLS